MTKSRNALILALVLSAMILMNGCGGRENANTSTNAATVQNTNSMSPKTNVEELGMLINVPYESEECFWRDDTAQKRIKAVLRFPKQEADRLIADAEKLRPAQRVNISSESWFPAELVAQSEMTGDDTLSGNSYAANAFFQAPYNEGRIIRIDDTDYFILEIAAK